MSLSPISEGAPPHDLLLPTPRPGQHSERRRWLAGAGSRSHRRVRDRQKFPTDPPGVGGVHMLRKGDPPAGRPIARGRCPHAWQRPRQDRQAAGEVVTAVARRAVSGWLIAQAPRYGRYWPCHQGLEQRGPAPSAMAWMQDICRHSPDDRMVSPGKVKVKFAVGTMVMPHLHHLVSASSSRWGDAAPGRRGDREECRTGLE